MRRWLTVIAMTLGGVASASVPMPAGAQTFTSGSTGADGAFTATCAPTPCTATVALPPTGVFNFTTVSVPSSVTLKFTRNAANTPVTVLASGDVTIAGTIDLSASSGATGATGTRFGSDGGAGGPGGFDGGAGSNGILAFAGGDGLGPGGGHTGRTGGGAGFAGSGSSGFVDGGAGTAYGTASLVPLIGGSGGGGGSANFGSTAGGAGGGGGAIVIASSGRITLTGRLLAVGGTGTGDGGGGSGGAIRLVAPSLAGTGGFISVAGGPSGNGTGSGDGSGGRIRIETFTNTATIQFVQVPSTGVPAPPLPTAMPTLAMTSIAGLAVPATLTSSFSNPDLTLPAGTTSLVTVALAATNIPPGTTVTVRVVGFSDGAATTSTTLVGTQASATASVSVAIPTNQSSVVEAFASFTLTAAAHGAPVYAEGEEIERVRVSAGLGGGARVAYVTRSGREVVVSGER